MKEMTTIDEESCQERLDTITQRHTSRQEEHQGTLPPFQLPSLHHALACHIECQQQQEHRDGKVVGYHDGEHDISHREIEHRHQGGIPVINPDDLAMNTIGEDIGIEGTDYQGYGYDILHAIDTQE